MFLGETLAHLFHPRRSNNHRPRVLHARSYLYLCLIALSIIIGAETFSRLSHSYGGILGFSSSITPAQVIEETNRERELNGLKPLKLNQTLTAAALAKGQNMLSEQYWAHTSPSGKEPWYFMKEAHYDYQVAGENLARDFATTDEMMNAWMNSPTHRANIINPKYQEIGIAVIDGKLLGYDTTLVVQMFGTTKSTVAQVGQGSSTVSVEAAAPAPLPRSTPEVLASALVNAGSWQVPPMFTPLQFSKAVFLAIILMLALTLVYDSFISGSRQSVRFVGKNLAHILFLTTVAFLLILFKGGVIG